MGLRGEQLTAAHQAYFTRGLYIAEYKLLVVLDQTDPRDDDILLSRTSTIYGSCRLAAYLYLYVWLREVPRTAVIVRKLATRLQIVLRGGGKDLLGVWKEDLGLLCWIAVMGLLVTVGLNNREEVEDGKYFIEILRKSKRPLGMEGVEDLRAILREVLWMESGCWDIGCELVWKAIST